MSFQPAGASTSTSISGNVIIGEISGQFVLTSISGQTVLLPTSTEIIAKISGQTITFGNTEIIARTSGQSTSVSGNIVHISGFVSTSVSGNIVHISGGVSTSGSTVYLVSGNNSILEYGGTIRANTLTTITSLSGGTELGSGIVFSVALRSMSGNSKMFIGGTGADAPVSGKGMIMWGNESQEFRVSNFNKIRIFAETSGQQVASVGVL